MRHSGFASNGYGEHSPGGYGMTAALVTEVVLLAADNQAACYGSLGAFSAGMSATEMAVIWTTGKIWLKVPETIKITLNGRLARGVHARDIALKLARTLASNGAEYKAIEFYGTIISSLSMPERLTLATVANSIGLKTAIVPFDDLTARYLRRTVKTKFAPVAADSDAAYCLELELDMTSLTPLASSLSNSDGIQAVEELEGKAVEQVVLGCCSGGRIEDLEIAAKMLRGRHITQDLRMMIIPGSRKVLSDALERGYIRTFLDAGCMILNPGCGSCLDAHNGYLEAGERAVTTAICSCVKKTANPALEIYQVSPATAVATALEGTVADPRKHIK